MSVELLMCVQLATASCARKSRPCSSPASQWIRLWAGNPATPAIMANPEAASSRSRAVGFRYFLGWFQRHRTMSCTALLLSTRGSEWIGWYLPIFQVGIGIDKLHHTKNTTGKKACDM